MSITFVSVAVLVTAVIVILILNVSLTDKRIDHVVTNLYAVEDEQFMRIMGVMLGPAIVAGNRATVLLNGAEIFPAMLAAIRCARATITLETFIYWSGSIGKEFAEALAERARRGVRVNVLLDWIGSGKISKEYLDLMKEAGVEVRRYGRPRWFNLGRMNNRTHRKLLVVDGRIGFTGGVGIADDWLGHAEDARHWRDTHFKVEGPVVAQIQAAFTDNWTEMTGTVLHGEDYFPPLDRAGEHGAQMFKSAPGGGSESMQLMYLLSIAAARESIFLSASYFVPDEVSIRTLMAALDRGVIVQILLPGPLIDKSIVRRASRARWGRLLEAGAEFYEYQPTMFHCKVMIVDRLWTSVGSTNFDSRSFAVNDEANLNIYDREFAEQQVRVFEDDLKRARRITFDEWKRRPLKEKVWEHAASLLGSQL